MFVRIQDSKLRASGSEKRRKEMKKLIKTFSIKWLNSRFGFSFQSESIRSNIFWRNFKTFYEVFSSFFFSLNIKFQILKWRGTENRLKFLLFKNFFATQSVCCRRKRKRESQLLVLHKNVSLLKFIQVILCTNTYRLCLILPSTNRFMFQRFQVSIYIVDAIQHSRWHSKGQNKAENYFETYNRW